MSLRRRQLASLALLPLVAGCGVFSSGTQNGVTTVTVNVAQLNAWGTALLNSAALILSLPGIAGTPPATAISVVAMAIRTDLAAFVQTAGSNVTLTFDSSSVPAAIKSLMDDAQQLLTIAQSTLSLVVSNSLQIARTYIAAIQTIVSLLTAIASSAAPPPAPMSERTALTTLKVTAH